MEERRRRKGATAWASVSRNGRRFLWLFPNGMTAESAEGFNEAPYLAAEFAVLRAMRGETIRDVNNCQSRQGRVTETESV